MTDKIIPVPMYGIWLKGKGWLRGASNQVYADYHRHVVQETSIRIGNNARVYFVDQSLIDLEEKLLDAEKNKSNRFIDTIILAFRSR